MSKIVITGGAGFIGSHVVDRLLLDGHEVLAIDNFSTGREENVIHHADQNRFHLLNADIKSPEAKREIAAFSPASIVHLAAQMNVRRSVEDPSYDAEQNILGTINLLAAAEESSVQKFIFSSTGGAIYGEQNSFPADEGHITRPECPYGVSKRAAELYIDYFSKKNHMHAISLRFGNVYGPRQNPHGEAGVVSIFVEQLLKGKALTINGSGVQTRDFIYVGDIVDAIKTLLAVTELKNDLYKVFNLGTGIESSVSTIADSLTTICKEQFPDMNPEVIYRPQPEGEQMRSLLDASAFSKEFGWKPEVTLREGLQKTFEQTRLSFNV